MLLKKSKMIANGSITISGSKSETNRLLILREFISHLELENLSDSQDTKLLIDALKSTSETIYIHHSGTAMRFLTAFFAFKENETHILTGSKRMTERPISPLVDALRELGADIEYLENDGFPPIKIKGTKPIRNQVKIKANISSQFITALLLIGSQFEDGISILLEGKITSLPYIQMTLDLLKKINQWEIHFENHLIEIKPKKSNSTNQIKIDIESDWSSASYYYSLVAIGREKLTLNHFKNDSLQGDKKIVDFYFTFFGINTIFEKDSKITLIPNENFTFPELISLNLNDCPDIAQTICVTASTLEIPFKITGLETLKIKETDRLVALQNELKKIGCLSKITKNSIESISFTQPDEKITIQTYNDHRMAMSFAPYCLKNEIIIENPSVVEKSYPQFWNDFTSIITN